MKVSVITGGAGGMGLATAKLLGRDHFVVICDVKQERLDRALEELRALNIQCDAKVCDITDRGSVDALVKHAATKGELASVVHSAGISPQMADADRIMRVNQVGTIFVTEAFYSVAREGFVLVNVASMAAHMLPQWLMPTRAFGYAFSNVEKCYERSLRLARLLPKGLPQTGMAYSISKNFVVWYSRKNAARFGAKGARVLSVSPGSFETEMGKLEVKSGAADMLKTAALKRFGRPEEIAELLAFCASDKAGYLTGVDILCDGGVIAGRG